jgi:hypothetical protein
MVWPDYVLDVIVEALARRPGMHREGRRQVGLP